MLKRQVFLACLASAAGLGGGLGGGPAWAQAETDGAWVVDARLTAAAGTLDGDAAGLPDADGWAADAGLTAVRRDVLEGGLALEWRGEVRLRRDAPGRPSFAGGFGECGTACLAGAGFVSPATGLFVGADAGGNDLDLFLEGASLSASGPWGEGVLGVDAGAAARLDARAPQVMEGVSAFSPMLDPGGLVMVRARNDVTGPSPKVTYMSPRWLGVRAGASYTPEANLAGADFDPDVTAPGRPGAELENVWEGALSFSRRFRSNGVRVRAALTAIRAESGSGLTAFDDYESFGAGLELERDGWSGGVRWLTSNNAWAAGGGDYEAVEVGLAREIEAWRFGLEWGSATDDMLGIEGESWLIGAQRKFGEHLSIGAAYQGVSDNYPAFSVPSGRSKVTEGGVVVEVSVRN